MPAVKSLTRERVLRAGVELADVHGLGAVTMRALGQALGVEAMSLYYYVANKAEVLDGMLELVAGEVPVDDGSDWRAAVRAQCVATHDALLRHRWSASLWIAGSSPGPVRLALMEALLRRLREAGFGPALLDTAFHTLGNHTVGHALQAIGFDTDRDELVAGATAFLADLDTEAFPELAAHVRWHLDRPAGAVADDAFGLGLDLLLDGLDRVRIELGTA